MGIPFRPSHPVARNHIAAVEDTDYSSLGAFAVACLTSGNCVIRDQNGTDVTYAMTAGQVLYIRANSIRAASTGTYALWY
jgi:hypothetical protein